MVAAGSDVYIAPGSEGEIPVILMGSRVVNQSTATLQTMALVEMMCSITFLGLSPS